MLGEDHIDTTRTEFDLGLVLSRLGDLESARRIQERVLRTFDRDYGPESEFSIRAAISLANTLRHLKLYGPEIHLRERILATRRKSLGPEHLDTYRSMVDLATVNHHLDNFKMSLDLNQIGLEGYERHGVDRDTIVGLKMNMATDLVRLKRSREASEIFESAYAEASAFLPSNDPLRIQAEKQKRTMALLGKYSRKLDESREKKRGPRK